ncbi:hypothetical protein LshimejAT787_0901180 [Lyophyllum shimeji]|uniref:F-box domain-containing protein n=1 Tax=Lyophyllum shimeji TaxID=47721 RepID=A0A9P3PRW0_LYOSH|nr:hypothetical protein LshimejAT787_0901180 [Lyophyllum shimeji]
MARTCRAFRDPANDYLWSEVDTFAPLVKCMPRDLWKEENRRTGPFLVFIRPIVSSDFRNFMEKNPHKITSTPDDVYAALSAAAAAGDLTLLPNLTYLSLLEPTSPAIYTFLGPKLAEFNLFVFLRDRSAGSLHHAFIASLPEHYSALRSLAILDAPGQLISDVLRGLPNLRMLHIPRLCLEPEALAHIMHLRHLRSLSFKSDESLTVPKSTSNLPVFGALRDLTHESIGAEGAMKLLQRMSRCPLVRVQIIISVIWTSHAVWCRLVQTLSAYLSHSSLTDLQIENRPRFVPNSGLSGLARLTIVDIRPLLDFSNISRLSLAILDLDDDGMEELAKAFPRLTMLDLVGEPDLLQPQITLCGLAAIARHCSEIMKLYITVDLSKNTEEHSRSKPWALNARLTLLLNEIEHGTGALTARSRGLR